MLFSFSVLLSGCKWFGNSPDFDDDFITYTIRPGNHDAENTLGLVPTLQTSRTLDFQAIFDESANYQTVDPGNMHDINKLLGYSDCGAHHQINGNSARFGWNWVEGKVRIYTYCYVNGQRIPEKILGDAEVGKIHRYKLEIEGDQYKFTMDNKVEYVERGCTGSGSGIIPSYRLFPYFGGDESAPQEIRIKIRML